MLNKLLSITLLLTLSLFTTTSEAGIVPYSDTEFDDSDWVMTKIIDNTVGATATGGAIKNSSGGNPGAYRRGTHDWTTKVSGASIAFSHINPTFVYDPSTQGEIVELNYDLDMATFSAPHVGGVGVGSALMQDGHIFTASGSTSILNTGWQLHEFLSKVSTDFTSQTTAGHPDFSTSGSPIQFGFFTSNGGSGTVRNLIATFGIDNYNVEVSNNPIPEPSTFSLLLIAGAALTRRRTQRG